MNHVLHVLVDFILTLFKQSFKIYLLKYKNRVIKNMFPERFWVYKEKFNL